MFWREGNRTLLGTTEVAEGVYTIHNRSVETETSIPETHLLTSLGQRYHSVQVVVLEGVPGGRYDGWWSGVRRVSECT